jgi:FkbM family methyltransferase
MTAPTPALRLLRWYARHAPGTAGKVALVDYLKRAVKGRPLGGTYQTRAGFAMHLSTTDVVERHLYLYGQWEPDLSHFVRGRLRPGDVFVDVGANVGYFSLLAGPVVGASGGVVAIEASASVYEALRRNLALNRATNVRPIHRAVAQGPGRLTFFEPRAGNPSVTTSVASDPDQAPAFEVAADRLPALLTAGELSRARIIKIDIEGGEYDAVAGLVGALPGLRPDLEIVVEISPELLAPQSHTADEVIAMLAEHGYHPYRVQHDYRAASYFDRRRAVPRRLTGPLTAQADIVFSRIDAATLGEE